VYSVTGFETLTIGSLCADQYLTRLRGAKRLATISPDQIESCLSRAKPFHPILRQIRIVFHHYRDFGTDAV
jgi:hypothetical protein